MVPVRNIGLIEPVRMDAFLAMVKTQQSQESRLELARKVADSMT